VDGSTGQLLHIAFYFRCVSNVIQGANKNVDPCSNRVIFGSCSLRSYKVKGKANVFPKTRQSVGILPLMLILPSFGLLAVTH